MRVRRRDHTDAATAAHDLLEQAKAGLFEVAGHIADDQRIAQIGLVRAVFEHGFGIRNAREFACRGNMLALCKGLECASDHRLHSIPHLFLSDEAHFQIELVEFARQAVSTRIFIAETRCDLEIAVEARDHQQLLVDLWRLRQRVEFARVDSAGYQEVTRTLWRRCGQDRGRKFIKADRVHPLAQVSHNPCAFHQVCVECFATQIEETVFQADVFRIFLLAGYRHGQFFRCALNGDRTRKHFNRSGRQVFIDRLWSTGLHLAVDRHNRFETKLLKHRKCRRIFVRYDLCHAVMIAQVDKQNPAMIAFTVDPAR